MSESIEVFRFQMYDMQADAMITSRYWATDEAIIRFRAEKIPGTGVMKAVSELDELGRYDPSAHH